MDISGPVRSLLRQHVPVAARDAFELAALLVALPGEAVAGLPAMVPAARRSHELLQMALLLRVLPRVNRGPREELAGILQERVGAYVAESQKLLVSRSVPPADQLCFYWMLVLARARMRQPVQEMQLKVLWKNAWSRQLESGSLHAVAGASLDVATYHDLMALHLGYNAILLTRDYDLFPPVQKLADYLVQTAQPDHTTSEPWGLAAFATLDASGTFAPQQVHDATVQLSSGMGQGMILGLLADALMAQEEAADA